MRKEVLEGKKEAEVGTGGKEDEGEEIKSEWMEEIEVGLRDEVDKVEEENKVREKGIADKVKKNKGFFFFFLRERKQE